MGWDHRRGTCATSLLPMTRQTAKGPCTKDGEESLGDFVPTESVLREAGLCMGMMPQQLCKIIISVPCFSLIVIGIKRTALLMGGKKQGTEIVRINRASRTVWLC